MNIPDSDEQQHAMPRNGAKCLRRVCLAGERARGTQAAQGGAPARKGGEEAREAELKTVETGVRNGI
eukprot:6205245-Pleurochrysis_carterae.AAC.6